MSRISKLVNRFLNFIEPIKEIVYFLFLFLLFEFIWKLCVQEYDDDRLLDIFGKNIAYLVYPFCLSTAKISFWFIHDVLGYTSFHMDNLFIYFENSLKIKIIFGCTGLKQMLQFTFIICCFWGPWKKKLLFIPTSIIILGLINYLRLIVTSFIIKDGFPDWFISFNESYNNAKWNTSIETYWIFYKDWYHFFHDTVFKWVYFDGVMFLLWLVWQEKFNRPFQQIKAKTFK